MKRLKYTVLHIVTDIPGGECAELTLEGDRGRSGRGGSSIVGGFDRCRIFAGAELVEAATGACLGEVSMDFPGDVQQLLMNELFEYLSMLRYPQSE